MDVYSEHQDVDVHAAELEWDLQRFTEHMDSLIDAPMHHVPEGTRAQVNHLQREHNTLRSILEDMPTENKLAPVNLRIPPLHHFNERKRKDDH